MSSAITIGPNVDGPQRAHSRRIGHQLGTIDYMLGFRDDHAALVVPERNRADIWAVFVPDASDWRQIGYQLGKALSPRQIAPALLRARRPYPPRPKANRNTCSAQRHVSNGRHVRGTLPVSAGFVQPPLATSRSVNARFLAHGVLMRTRHQRSHRHLADPLT
jgi:hypothetical protein